MTTDDVSKPGILDMGDVHIFSFGNERFLIVVTQEVVDRVLLENLQAMARDHFNNAPILVVDHVAFKSLADSPDLTALIRKIVRDEVNSLSNLLADIIK